MGGKVLVPTREAVEKLNAARLAAVMGTDRIVGTDRCGSCRLIDFDIDDNDKPFPDW